MQLSSDWKERSKMKLVIVIDMQNDFIDMALGTKEAVSIVKPMAEYLSKLDKNTVALATRDTHHSDYMNTNEGKHLPVPHCIEGTKGWEINETISSSVTFERVLNKPNFGISAEVWKTILDSYNPEEITLIGLCTDICVISNALALKNAYPELPVRVIESLCAGVTPETHNAAITTMKMCQVDIL